MKSHNHHLAFLCASILLFALAFAATTTPASAQSDGLNVLSVSNPDYSWSGEVQKNAWTLLITQSSKGERIHAVFSKDEITGKDPITGEQGFATHDIEISMNPISTTCNYRIEPKPEWINPHIYTASVYTVRCGLLSCDWHGDSISLADWRENCEAGGGDFRENEQGILGEQQVLACFYTTDMGTHGVLQTPTYDFTTEVIITKIGDTRETISTVIGNHDKAAHLGPYGHIEWVGSWSSGEYCSMLDLPDAVYTPENGWTLTDDDGYAQYSSHYSSQWVGCKLDFETYEAQDAASAIKRAEECAKSLNDAAEKALAPKAIDDPTIIAEISNKYAADGAVFKANIKSNAVFYPTYKLILYSSWVGIYVPKPEPSITNIKSDWDASTSQGKFWVDIENVGDEGGDFTYGITCQSPAQGTEPERSDCWDKDQVKTVDLSVTGVVSKETIATCTVYVYDTKYPDIRDERMASITVKPIPTPKLTKPIPTSTPTGAGATTQGETGRSTPTSTLFLYGILGLVFIGIIVIAFLWRRSGTKAPAPAEPGSTEAKRPLSAKWVVAIIIILLILALCLFVVTSLKQPEVLLKSVSVKGFESINLLIVEIPTEVIFSVVLEVYNPNFLGATVTDVEYDLYVNDVYVGKGSLPRAVTIPANGKTNVETEVSVSVSSSIQALVTTIQQGSATAKVNGNVYIGVPIRGSISVPFSEEQRLV